MSSATTISTVATPRHSVSLARLFVVGVGSYFGATLMIGAIAAKAGSQYAPERFAPSITSQPTGSSRQRVCQAVCHPL